VNERERPHLPIMLSLMKTVFSFAHVALIENWRSSAHWSLVKHAGSPHNTVNRRPSPLVSCRGNEVAFSARL